MKPTQKQLDEFVLDLVEFFGKHFSSAFTKTKMISGNVGVTLLIKNETFASELEISTERCEINIALGAAKWKPGSAFISITGDETKAWFTQAMTDLAGVFGNRIILLTAYRGNEVVEALTCEMEYVFKLAAEIKKSVPGCDRITMKKWDELGKVIDTHSGNSTTV